MVDQFKVKMFKITLYVVGVIVIFLVGFGFGQIGHGSKQKDNAPKQVKVTNKELSQKEVEKFLISYFTKKELGENDERYKSYVTAGLYDKLTELEKKSSQQAYKGYYVNYTYESSDIYINNKKNTALVVVNYLYDSKKTLDSKELAQKGITAKATYKLTYSNSNGKFLVSDIVSQNIVDGDNLMLDTGFIQEEQTEKPDQTGQTEEQHE